MMQLLSVLEGRRSSAGDEAVIDLMIEVDAGNGPETWPYTYSPADPHGLAPAVGQWLGDHPAFVIEDAPPAPEPVPSDFVLSDRQLRLGLIAAGVLPSTVRSSIEAALADPLEREAMLTWFDYTRDIRWDHPVTQQLMAIAGFTPETAATMWLAAAQIAA